MMNITEDQLYEDMLVKSSFKYSPEQFMIMYALSMESLTIKT